MLETAVPLSPEEIAARGDKLYKEQIESKVASCRGQVVAIDVLSGDYSVATNASLAVRDLRTRKPNAVTFGVRIGSRTFARIGRGPRKVK
ncbi:MAG: hypothetical protein ACKV2Q_25100 [Planctomycetaceae bacterium]